MVEALCLELALQSPEVPIPFTSKSNKPLYKYTNKRKTNYAKIKPRIIKNIVPPTDQIKAPTINP